MEPDQRAAFRSGLRRDAANLPAGLSDDERRRLDAAERLIEQRFGVRADLYY